MLAWAQPNTIPVLIAVHAYTYLAVHAYIHLAVYAYSHLTLHAYIHFASFPGNDSCRFCDAIQTGRKACCVALCGK